MRILVTGAGGFIGHHLVNRLKRDGDYIFGCDVKRPEYETTNADQFFQIDLRRTDHALEIFRETGQLDEVYHLAADMGGMGFIENNCFAIMRNNAQISVNVIEGARQAKVGRLFFSSSACIYNTDLQTDPEDPSLSEDMAYPAKAEPGYGWEKLYTEMMCEHLTEDYGIPTRSARYHNVYGPLGTWRGGREKAPAAICRKVALAPNGGEIEIWGDGEQTRSFMYIDDCIEGTLRIMRGDHAQPLNLGSDHLISINDLAQLAMTFEKKALSIKHIPGPLGVRGRNSNNTRIKQVMHWSPTISLEMGLRCTYDWIVEEIERANEFGQSVETVSKISNIA